MPTHSTTARPHHQVVSAPSRRPAPDDAVTCGGPPPASTGRSSLRLAPAPQSEPPYDDELQTVPTLRLVPLPRPELDPQPAHPRADPHPYVHEHPEQHEHPGPARGDVPHLRLAPRRPAPAPTRQPASTARPFAHALVQRLLEVSAGVRPVTQLRPDTTPELFDQLERALTARPRASGLRPSRRDVRSVHLQERPEGVAEVCATVVRGQRVGALALRLDRVAGRWLCTQVMGI